MFERFRAGLAVLAACLLASCATAPRSETFVAAGRGDRFLADSVYMTGNEEIWGSGMQLADFQAGVVHEGVTCLEARVPFGETAIAWLFTGLGTDRPVEVAFDVNVDFFSKQTYLHVAYLPGRHEAREGKEPRDLFREHLVHGWADGSAEWPDSTDGWETIRHRLERAGPDGSLTVMMIFGHPKDSPPIVYGYLTNPAARPAGDE